MPRFEPFRGIRYDVARLDPAAVTAPPYDVISPEDRQALVEQAPENVVRIDLPIPDPAHPDADPYVTAAELFQEWRAAGVLVDDDEPTFTVYRMEVTDDDGTVRRTTGVIGSLELSRPGEGGILPHEFTTPKAKSDRLDLLRSTSANLSPVWGLSPAEGLSALLAVDDEPLAQFDGDDVTHTVWRITDPDRVAAIAGAISAQPIVIADGHHRYETSLAYRDERREAADDDIAGGAESVLCFVVELVDEELTVGPIHRLIDSLPAGFDLVGALEPFFELEPIELAATGAVRQLQEAEGLGLVTPDGTWLLRPRPEAMAAARDLDSSRLDVALAALPDPTVVYQHGVDNIRAAVAKGDAQAGVLLRPATVAQILEIAHGGERMPPKTTFFFPKPRTGIVFRDLT
ncbi:MAG TPA: DUF1015 domain-containing protein [Acidimicrobiales bacterium]